MITKSHALSFFMISNLIEGIDDWNESKAMTDIFFSSIQDEDDEKLMYYLHSKLNYLNNYCIAGRLRTYPVYVGGRECLHYANLESALFELFCRDPKTYKEIKQWHIDFEKIHPFGDGNGRVGRFLMLRQMVRNGINPPHFLCTNKFFQENRQQYYRWFK